MPAEKKLYLTIPSRITVWLTKMMVIYSDYIDGECTQNDQKYLRKLLNGFHATRVL